MNSFYTSTNSLFAETVRIQQYIESKFQVLLFNPFILENDIDYKSYCLHYNSLKEYSKNLSADLDINLIKRKFEELPAITSTDFQFSTFGIPFYLLCVFFPLNLIAWGRNYAKLSLLKEALTDAKRQLGTIDFMLKASVS